MSDFQEGLEIGTEGEQNEQPQETPPSGTTEQEEGGEPEGEGRYPAWDELTPEEQVEYAEFYGHAKPPETPAQPPQAPEAPSAPAYAPYVQGSVFNSPQEKLQWEQWDLHDHAAASEWLADRRAQIREQMGHASAQTIHSYVPAPLVQKYGPAMQRHLASLPAQAQAHKMGADYALGAAIVEQGVATGKPFDAMADALRIAGYTVTAPGQVPAPKAPPRIMPPAERMPTPRGGGGRQVAAPPRRVHSGVANIEKDLQRDFPGLSKREAQEYAEALAEV